MRRSLLLALALAGCVRPAAPANEPPPPAVDRLTPPPPPPAAADWRDRPQTQGTWVYQRDTRGSRALFGPRDADALVVLRCDAAERRLFLSRAGASAAPLIVRTTSLTRSLAAQPTGAAPPYAATALALRDPLLDAMAFSRGRFAVEQAGAAPLAIPAWAEIGRVIEDCRG